MQFIINRKQQAKIIFNYCAGNDTENRERRYKILKMLTGFDHDIDQDFDSWNIDEALSIMNDEDHSAFFQEFLDTL